MRTFYSLLALGLFAVVTQHIVSWAGSMLSSIGSEETNYAVFTFTDDRYLPMTTNILMNVCIPNIVMIFIFMTARHYNLIEIENNLIFYVVSFYVYRLLLICVLLRRKEMYTPIYEIGMAITGIGLSYFIIHFFLTTEETVFITASELREELWFIIIIILFQFFKQIFDKKVKQNDVLTKGQITKYVINKFNLFYKKYNELIDINIENRYLSINEQI